MTTTTGNYPQPLAHFAALRLRAKLAAGTPQGEVYRRIAERLAS